MAQRRLASVPRPLLLLVPLALAAQITFGALQARPQARAEELTAPPSAAALRALSLVSAFRSSTSITAKSKPGLSASSSWIRVDSIRC
jgi:hypothetical protein